MLVFEFKAYEKAAQFAAVDDAIRTAKFIRNNCIRLTFLLLMNSIQWQDK